MAESAPVVLVRGDERIEVPPSLLELEHPHSSPAAGDGRLHVAARDPHWLYVYWDFTREQQAALNRESNHGHLIVRVYANSLNNEPSAENHVHPQSRHWFTHVELAGVTYYAELGLYAGGGWRRAAVAGPVTTPRRRFALDTSATYLTLHPDRPLEEQLHPRPAAAEVALNEPPCDLRQLPGPSLTGDWSPGQALAVLRALGVIRGEEPGSGDSGVGDWLASFSLPDRLSSETDSPGSTVGAFGAGNPGSVDRDEWREAASSGDAPLFLLLDLPHSSA